MSALREALRELPAPVFGDVLESEDAYLLVIDLPGATAETTDVRAEDNRLVIEARREKAHGEEFRYLEENRALFLDAEIPLLPDAAGEQAEASMDRGVLELRIPKQESAGEQTIPIED